MYDYKVKWCPVCHQGWVQVFKEVSSGRLYFCCDECESEWRNPDEITVENATRDCYGRSIDPTMDEIHQAGWESCIMR